MRRWLKAIRSDRRRASRFGLFWLLMCVVTVCAWFIPRVAETAGGMLRMSAFLLVAAGAGFTVAPMRLSGAIAGGTVMSLHLLFQTACQSVYFKIYPLMAVRGSPWARPPRWTDALAEALIVLLFTFALGAAVGYVAARFRFWREKA